jgi:hypothetical protein
MRDAMASEKYVRVIDGTILVSFGDNVAADVIPIKAGGPSFSGGFAVGARSFPVLGKGRGFGALVAFPAIGPPISPRRSTCNPPIGSST